MDSFELSAVEQRAVREILSWYPTYPVGFYREATVVRVDFGTFTYLVYPDGTSTTGSGRKPARAA
jgi:hypothetical protein